MILNYIVCGDVAAHKKGWFNMKHNSFRELMTASQCFAAASSSISESCAYANEFFIEKKDNFSCSKFHLSLAISQFRRAEFYFNCFLKEEGLNYCDFMDIPHTNEELI